MYMEDLYKILGVSSTASVEEIKNKYRFLAQAYHPDKFASEDHRRQAEDAFKRISTAYQVLSNSDRRAVYDRGRIIENEQHHRPEASSQESVRPSASRVNIRPKPLQSVTNKTQLGLIVVIFIVVCGFLSFFSVLSFWSEDPQSPITLPNTKQSRITALVEPIGTDVVNTPTVNPTFTLFPTSTSTPLTTFLTGGDIGKGWSNTDRRIGLVDVYRTEAINGVKPFGERLGGYRGGYTQFLVIKLQFERFAQGYDEYDLTDFWLSSYSTDGYLEYGADQYLFDSPRIIRVYYQENASVTFAFEVRPDSHNFIMCYQTSVGVDFSGKIVSECGPYGYQFKFGD